MPISFYEDKQICMYVRMDGCTYIRTYIRVYNECMCGEVCLYICWGMLNISIHMYL
jgi:hypothetical protein